ncbi:hypothetical protein GCM10023191_079210 [Actinoallomurus oryzae]|uniref:Restriction system protein Mrr-like N-terminal domain-containing protein n=1 Tax=Actinoallomurus oryzae TaxID=502180 RepID=A0ABP8QXZ8_9ACTN
MSFAEHIAPIFRAAMEVLRDAGRPLQPAEVREAVAARVTIDPEHENPNAHGQVRWHSQLGFRTGEAASLGWMTKRNGWAITEAGIQALEEFPGDELYRALGRQYRARRQASETRTYADPKRVPTPFSDAQEDSNGHLAPFDQFQRNINYARQLIQGGQNLEHLKVGAFDVTDLYRAAWSQAVAAIDHWVTREIVDRGVVLALRPGVPRPAKFDKLTMPVALFEKIHHHSEPLAEVFRAHLEREFEYKTFQSPEKIQEGFAHVSEVKLWVKVAEILTNEDPRSPVTSDEVRARMREIARRRNNIAHTADHNPDQPDQKLPISADEAEETIAWLESIALAIQQALGDPAPPVIDYDSAPAEAGTLGPAPAPIGERRDDAPHAKREWDEESLLEAINRYCPGKVANALLAVYRHAERHGAFRGYHYGEGEYPSVTARFSVGTDEAAAWSVYIGVTKSVLSINFAELRDHGVPPQTLSQLAGNLSRLPGWADVSQQLKKADYAARVSIESAALAEHNTANVVIEGFNTLLASASGRS